MFFMPISAKRKVNIMRKRVIIFFLGSAMLCLIAACVENKSVSADKSAEISTETESSVTPASDPELTTISFSQLMDGGAYQVADFPWYTPISDIIGNASPSDEQNDTLYYDMHMIQLEGIDAVMQVQTEAERSLLTGMSLICKESDKAERENLYQQISQKLIELAGEPLQTENSETSESITWTATSSDGNQTNMQLINDTANGTVLIHLNVAPEPDWQEASIRLDSLYDGQVFRYKDLPWSISKEEVEQSLGETLESIGIGVDYRLPATVRLEETDTNVNIAFQFYDGKLQTVGLTTTEQDSAARLQLYNTWCQKATELFGEPAANRSNEDFEELSWSASAGDEDTMLSVFYQKSGDSISIAVAIKES